MSFAHNLWTFTWFVHFKLPFGLKGTEKIHTETVFKFPSNIYSILYGYSLLQFSFYSVLQSFSKCPPLAARYFWALDLTSKKPFDRHQGPGPLFLSWCWPQIRLWGFVILLSIALNKSEIVRKYIKQVSILKIRLQNCAKGDYFFFTKFTRSTIKSTFYNCLNWAHWIGYCTYS